MRHLARRFLGFLRARPLTPTEQAWVVSSLDTHLHPLFFSQPYQDQRHAVEVAMRVAPDLVEAGLLHDVGKSVSRLSAISRVLATTCELASIPVTGRWRLYLDHGDIGARMLEDAGASRLTVAFAHGHPGPVPVDVDASAWHALAASDEA